MNNTAYTRYKARLDEVCAKYAAWPALRCMKDDGTITSVTYGELKAMIRTFRKRMDELGLKPGDRVALMESHLPSAERTFVSASYWNLTVVLMDASLPDAEIRSLLAQTDVRAVFTDAVLAQKLGGAGALSVPVLDVRQPEGKYPLLPQGTQTVTGPATPDPDQEAIAILFSSGTTGSMKPIVIPFEAILFSWQTNRRAADLRHEDDYLYVFPLNHISGLESSLTLLLCGATLDMVDTFSASVIPKALAAYQPRVFGMVPKVFDIMVQRMEQTVESKGKLLKGYYTQARKVSAALQKKFGNRAVGHLLMKPFSTALFGKNIKTLFTGSAMCAADTAAAMVDMGVYWCNLFASTECGAPITTTDRFDRYAPSSVGNIRHNPGIDIKLHEPDANGVGEIYVKTKQIMKGYFRDPKLTAEAFDNGYFKTGDLGWVDKEGYLYLAGRKKDSIQLHNGKKVAPTDLEEMLAPICPAENSVVICGVPEGKRRFDEIHAFFEDKGLNAEERKKITDRLIRYAKEKMPLYPIKEVHFLKEIPKTSVMKVKRYLLIDHVLKRRDDAPEAAPVQEAPETAPVQTEAANSDLATLAALICERTHQEREVKPTDTLQDDLGLDSLTIYELCAGIEEKWGVFLGNALRPEMTVEQVLEAIHNPPADAGSPAEAETAGEFPRPRNAAHLTAFKTANFLSRRVWALEARGTENLPAEGGYILCPNHSSNLDVLWLFASMGRACPPLEKVACMAKKELLGHWFTRFAHTVMGGIPVDRGGASSSAVEHSRRWLEQGGRLVLFPEGTRTRSGALGEFKPGAAQLAVETGVPLVPVRLNGAFETYPAGTKMPKIGKKCRIRVTIGAPIAPQGKTPQELTDAVRAAIEEMGQE